MEIDQEFELNEERHTVWNVFEDRGVLRLTLSGYKDISGVPMFAVTEWCVSGDGRPVPIDTGYKEHLVFENVQQAKRAFKRIVFTFSPRYGFMLVGCVFLLLCAYA